ncbi:hypothetical protein K461DRAFT_281325, partial [Myriangium duriaei CBS 260.36]
MRSVASLALGAALAAAQGVPPPPPVLLTTTKSAVLPVLPTPFSGVETLEGAIIAKGPPNASYVGLGGSAQVQSNLPSATYAATLPAQAFNGLTGTNPSGTISISSNQGDTGVTFVYHIHDSPVPSDGNCTSTLAHFDVTNVGEYYPCIVSSPQNCQTGDVAGKHGAIMASTFTTSYKELYLSTDPSSQYFVGTKSIVIHTSNTTRLTCANFQLTGGSGSGNGTGTSGANSTSTSSGSGSGTSSTAPAQYTGAASKVVAGGAVAGLAGIFAML